jgi:integrase
MSRMGAIISPVVVTHILPCNGKESMNMAVRKRYGNWYVTYPIGRKPDGKIKYGEKKVGKYKRQADEMDEMLRAEFKKRELLGISHEKKKQMSFVELADWYVELPKVKTRRSYKDIKRMALSLKDYFGKFFLDEITPSMVEKYQTERAKTVKPATVNRYLATVKRMFNLAVREGYAEKNPCWKVEMFRERQRDRVISHEDFEKLIYYMPDHTADITSVAYYSGMRRGEILSLKWNQVNLAQRVVNLQETKNDEPRKIYLNDRLLEIFRHRLFEHPEYVFTYEGKPIKTVRRSFNRACRIAGIENFRFHDLRHCFRTNLRRAGVEQTVSMKMLGHRSIQAHEIYNSFDREDFEGAHWKLAKHLGN